MFNLRFYVLILVAIVVTSCHNHKTCTVEVSISDATYRSCKGTTVKLFVDDVARDSLTIDSTKFQFRNVLIKDSALNYSYIEINGFDWFPHFVLSKDTVFIKETPFRNVVSGSELNNQISRYVERFYKINDSIETIRLRDTLVSDTFSSKYLLDSATTAQINRLYNGYLSYSKGIIKEHKNDALGLIALLNLISDKKINLSEKIDYVKSMSKLIQNNREVRNIISILELEETLHYSNILNFSGVNIDGKKVKLSDYIGKKEYLLVSFMNSYRYPQNMSELQKLTKVTNKDSILVVMAMIYSPLDEVKPIIKKLNIKYPCIINNDINPEILKSIYILPTIILFNSKGGILKFCSGVDSVRIGIDSLCTISRK